METTPPKEVWAEIKKYFSATDSISREIAEALEKIENLDFKKDIAKIINAKIQELDNIRKELTQQRNKLQKDSQPIIKESQSYAKSSKTDKTLYEEIDPQGRKLKEAYTDVSKNLALLNKALAQCQQNKDHCHKLLNLYK